MEYNEDDAPPPYSAIDPRHLQQLNVNDSNVSSSTGGDENTNTVQLETGISSLNIRPSSPSSPSITLAESVISTSITEPLSLSDQPTPRSSSQFASTSAAGYFAEQSQQLPATGDVKREILIHHMTIYARSQGKDFRRRPRCWNSRADEIDQRDWDTFLNFLLPAHLEPAASSNRLPPRVRAEIGRDRKDRSQETDEQRSIRINEVITDWNDHFFGLRGVFVTCTYVADLEEGPASPLCPNCYPQASNASRARDRGTTARRSSTDAPIPVSSETPPRVQIKRRPVPQSTHPTLQHPNVVPTIPTTVLPSQDGSPFSVLFPENYQSSASWNTYRNLWATQINSIAQEYANRITSQAQDYSRAIEANALARSRQVESYRKNVELNALARSRQIEMIALAQGRRIEDAGDRIASWVSAMRGNRSNNNINNNNNIQTGQSAYDPSSSETTINNQSTSDTHSGQPRSRRLSTASDRSISSVSSIDTVSSVSALEPDDLASIREQLASLDGYHSHELYDAAVTLRNQLHGMKRAHFNDMIRSQRRNGLWGRWESPEEAANREQRRLALKREYKLLRAKFAEVERRAKREVHDLRKTKRDMKRRQWAECFTPSRPFGSNPSSMSSLQQHGRTVSDMDANSAKELPAQGPRDSFHRTISEPASAPETGTENESQPAEPESEQEQEPALDPHKAAKAWTEAQRNRIKEIQKANKERLKEIQKSHKQFEKQQRKEMKKKSKQKPSLTTSTSTSSSGFTAMAPSATSSYSETGTIGTGTSTNTSSSGGGSKNLNNNLDDSAATTHPAFRKTDGTSRNTVKPIAELDSGVRETQISELDGEPLRRP